MPFSSLLSGDPNDLLSANRVDHGPILFPVVVADSDFQVAILVDVEKIQNQRSKKSERMAGAV